MKQCMVSQFIMGIPIRKITFTSNPYDWFEASSFILIFKIGLIAAVNVPFCQQDYKDKGFNAKIISKNRDIYQL